MWCVDRICLVTSGLGDSVLPFFCTKWSKAYGLTAFSLNRLWGFIVIFCNKNKKENDQIGRSKQFLSRYDRTTHRTDPLRLIVLDSAIFSTRHFISWELKRKGRSRSEIQLLCWEPYVSFTTQKKLCKLSVFGPRTCLQNIFFPTKVLVASICKLTLIFMSVVIRTCKRDVLKTKFCTWKKTHELPVFLSDHMWYLKFWTHEVIWADMRSCASRPFSNQEDIRWNMFQPDLEFLDLKRSYKNGGKPKIASRKSDYLRRTLRVTYLYFSHWFWWCWWNSFFPLLE